MTSLPVEHPVQHLEVSVQEQPPSSVATPIPHITQHLEVGYQHYDAISETTPIPHITQFTEIGYQHYDTIEETIPFIWEPTLETHSGITVGIKPSSYGGSADYIKIYVDGVGWVDATSGTFRVENDIPKADFDVTEGQHIIRVALHHTGQGWSDPTDVWIWDSKGEQIYSTTASSHTWDSSFPNYFEYVGIDYTVPSNLPGPTITVKGGINSLRVIATIVQYAFKGYAFLWDGSKLSDFPRPGVYVVYPQVAVDEQGRAIYIGGLTEAGDIQNELMVYGSENYTITADRNYLAMVIPSSEPVQVYDDQGNVIQTIKGSGTTPLLEGWRLSSRKQFSVILLPL